MKKFEIFTEEKNREEVEKLLAKKVDGFTLTFGLGYWISTRGETCKENSLIITLLTNEEKVVRSIAEEIKKMNNQESVLVVETKVKGEFI